MVHVVIEQIWNRGELELADSFFSSDYVNHGGLVPDVLRGPEAIMLSVAMFRSAFPTFRIAVHDLTTENGAMVIRWVARCVPPGSVPSALDRRGLRGITRCRLHDGMIAESWTVWDTRAALVEMVALRRGPGTK
jgi:hypothetical protein